MARSASSCEGCERVKQSVAGLCHRAESGTHSARTYSPPASSPSIRLGRKSIPEENVYWQTQVCNRNDDQTFSGASLGSAATRVNYQSSALEFNIVKAQTFGDKLADWRCQGRLGHHLLPFRPLYQVSQAITITIHRGRAKNIQQYVFRKFNNKMLVCFNYEHLMKIIAIYLSSVTYLTIKSNEK